ncbi:LysM peptidoglycan-binding domain-containing protein [Pseudoalteromonas aliena]|uniref:LysM peptidoglycan-binding domain-containing protein n=1 Tax=Pseudoalteromonas aliena TaxID=247523 RepID=UPI002494E945|nr:LysM peptidoglycan-binding domain-containing protein [Pseudoalteromonas aliena]
MNIELIYTVQPGDTLSAITSSIQACAGVTINQVEQANPRLAPDALRIGELALIPYVEGSGHLVYTIRANDSFASICAHLTHCKYITENNILAANPGLQISTLQIGELLNIPAASSVSSVTLSPDAGVMGYWHWTYSHASTPNNATLSIAFSGYADPQEAINNATGIESTLVGSKFICFGGGNEKGAFNGDILNDITNAIEAGKLQAYDGIAFDIEEGDSGLADYFQTAFKTAKQIGFQVFVTVSHSAPYGIADAKELMAVLLADENIDYISPQLYTTGSEDGNDYDTSQGVTWKDYANCKAAVVPSIVKSEYYTSAQTYFKQQGVTLSGYIQWQQTNS